MKKQISLRLFLTLVFLTLMLLLIGGYSLLSIRFYRMGQDSLTAATMESIARHTLHPPPDEHRRPSLAMPPLPDGGRRAISPGYCIADSWDELPPRLRQAFTDRPTAEHPLLIHREDGGPGVGPGFLNVVYLYSEGNQSLYIGQRTVRPPGPDLLGETTRRTQLLLVLITIVVAGAMALALYLLFRRIGRPIKALEQWVGTLGPHELSQSPPDFSYPELNRMAELVRTSLASVEQSLARERQFLRYASHELRTPIATVRNNLELMAKIEKLPEPHRTEENALVRQRLDRAGRSMHHLTNTLLWLYRDDARSLQPEALALNTLLAETVESMEYLLERKEVQVEMESEPCTISTPEVPARIVVQNLVRNAFQHTEEGLISIRQHGGTVTVTNPRQDEEPAASRGFGFGLQLIEDLTTKLGWRYSAISGSRVYEATVAFDSAE